VDAFFNRQLAKNERRESFLSRYTRLRVHRRKHQSSSHKTRESPKKKIEKKSAHYSHFLLFTLEFFASHTKPNFNYSRVPSVYKERSYIYIYIYIKREREKGYSPRCALIFLLVIRRETRDKFRIFFFFSEPPPPPQKQKKKRIEKKKKKKKKSEKREKLFWGDKE